MVTRRGPETYIIHASEPDTLSYMHQQEYEIWIWRKHTPVPFIIVTWSGMSISQLCCHFLGVHPIPSCLEPNPSPFFFWGGGIFTYFVCLQWVGPFKLQFTLFSFVTLFESNFDNKDDFDIYSSCKTPPNSRAITLLRRERRNLEFDQRKMWYLTRRDFD